MSKKASNNLPEGEEVKEDITTLKANAAALAQQAKEEASDQIRETAGTLRTSAQTGLKKIEKRVEAKPIQSVAIAFAGGLLASLLLGRR